MATAVAGLNVICTPLTRSTDSAPRARQTKSVAAPVSQVRPRAGFLSCLLRALAAFGS
ncbi:MAG: hypothetical protein L0Z62_02715 [Gemmataceae bacterium]|nr:hypothetical protein [Gemmataceae bacterium]